jgi:hypothetical protein
MERVLEFLTWDMEGVGAFHEKKMSNVNLHSFHPFNSPFQSL